MDTAKLFQHGGSQAVRLPKSFRFEGNEVIIERRGDEVVLKPLPSSHCQSFAELAAHLAETYPDAADFPDPPPRPLRHERPAPEI